MACSCITNTEIVKNEKLNLYYISETKPFEICPLCAFKHLAYALIKWENNEKNRALANIYLAYKHLNKAFAEESTKLFNLIILYFENKLTVSVLEEIVQYFHNFAMQYKNKENSFTELKNPIMLENTAISNAKRIYLNLLSVNELFNFEVGYKDINTPYCIGLLQQCTEYEQSQIQQNRIRGFWKSIEQDKKLSSNQILEFAEDFLYREEKDKNI